MLREFLSAHAPIKREWKEQRTPAGRERFRLARPRRKQPLPSPVHTDWIDMGVPQTGRHPLADIAGAQATGDHACAAMRVGRGALFGEGTGCLRPRGFPRRITQELAEFILQNAGSAGRWDLKRWWSEAHLLTTFGGISHIQ